MKMFGRHVYVKFKGKMMEVFVTCVPSTPYHELQERALSKLQRIYDKRNELSLDDIQILMQQGRL